MALQQDPGHPELWANAGWNPGSGPGTFAVVIGVSRYHNLPDAPLAPAGGGDPGRAEKYGLAQLDVTALTAYRFFEWLAARYDHPEAPLARCWLLASPTDKEKALAPGIAKAPDATFAACRDAIEQWFGAMEQLHPDHAEKSRALFFFSGHGLELTTDHQVLLPSDYLRPPAAPLNEAISTANLWMSLRGLAVNEHVLLLDACRNGPAALRGVTLEGAQILNEASSAVMNRNTVVPIVYAAAAGEQAWQPQDPKEGLSVFGQALLEGLQASSGLRPVCEPPPCRVPVATLLAFLRSRVAEIHAQRASRAVQRVQFMPRGFGNYEDELVLTRVPAPPKARAIAGAFESLRRRRPAPDAIQEVPGAPSVSVVANGTPSDFAKLHTLFDSEALSAMWDGARLEPLDGAAGGPARFTLLRVGRDEGRRAFRAFLRVEQPGAFWLRLEGPRHGGRPSDTLAYGCVLPGDAHALPVYRLELWRPERGEGVERIEVSLSDEEGADPRHRAAARLWRRYRDARRGEPVDPADERLLLGALEEKAISPLAATVAGLVFLRTRDEKLPTPWLRNLASVDVTFAPELRDVPDGPVLLVERLLRELGGKRAPPSPGARGARTRLRATGGADAEEIVRALLALEARGLPRTLEALGLASAQLRELTRLGLDPADPDDARDLARLRPLLDRISRALALSRPGGLFDAFIGPTDEVVPSLVGPTR